MPPTTRLTGGTCCPCFFLQIGINDQETKSLVMAIVVLVATITIVLANKIETK
jgi:hypothetical protein